MLTNLDAPSSVDSPAEETALPIRKLRRSPRIDGSFPPPQPSFAQHLYRPLRRVLDFALALLLCVVAVPIVFLAAWGVRLTSRGPAFYTQIRVGRNGRPFTIYKIRTMIHNCESLTGPRWTIPGDPRITPLGWLLRRTHLDELPQLLNVLNGEMSLVGPRPERPEFVAELEQAIPGYEHRHAVLPGITGLAQVLLPPDTDIDSVRAKLVHDLHFIEHLSPLLDLRILAGTVLHMLGLPFALMRTLRIVPTPMAREIAAPMPETTLAPRKQAA